jgi:hypothetical protein
VVLLIVTSIFALAFVLALKGEYLSAGGNFIDFYRIAQIDFTCLQYQKKITCSQFAQHPQNRAGKADFEGDF